MKAPSERDTTTLRAFCRGRRSTRADLASAPRRSEALFQINKRHRGYSSKELSVWRSTLDHFDAIKIGLTATPAAHTTAYFENMVYRHEYERAVREGYLVDYDIVSIDSNVRMNGVFLEEGEQVEAVDPMSGVKSRSTCSTMASTSQTSSSSSFCGRSSRASSSSRCSAAARERERRTRTSPNSSSSAASTRSARVAVARGLASGWGWPKLEVLSRAPRGAERCWAPASNSEELLHPVAAARRLRPEAALTLAPRHGARPGRLDRGA